MPEVGYAPVNGLQMYWESRGEGRVPLIVSHGGFGTTAVFAGLLDELAAARRVIAIELQGHAPRVSCGRRPSACCRRGRETRTAAGRGRPSG